MSETEAAAVAMGGEDASNGRPAPAEAGAATSNPAPVADGEGSNSVAGDTAAEVGTVEGGSEINSKSKGGTTEASNNGAQAPLADPAASEDAHAASAGGSEADGDEDSAADSEGTQDFSDDEDEGKEGYKKGGYHPVKVGEVYNNNLVVMRKLGWGHFSTVWCAWDRKKKKQVALKVQKSASHYTEAAMDEIDFLNKAASIDHPGSRQVVRLWDSFKHTGLNGNHVCMVFEPMGPNLLALIKHFNYRGIPMDLVRCITRQVLEGLDFLHSKCSIIHTDLKPENVLLCPIEGEYSENLDDEANALATQLAAAQPLTKNQKKRLKEKKKKLAKQAAERTGAAVEGDSSAASVATTPPQDADGEKANGASARGKERSNAEKSPQKGADGARPPPGIAALCEGQEIGAKVVDLGNACYTHKHFTEDIQTRQYRSPEVILGATYDTSADMWSLACMVFELVTGDLLFDPHEGEGYDRDEDHLAQMQELLGRMPKGIAMGGHYSLELFNRKGELRNIRRLKFWDLTSVLVDKYRMHIDQAAALNDFLVPMLEFDTAKRATAAHLLSHPWLQGKLHIISAATTKDVSQSAPADDAEGESQQTPAAPAPSSAAAAEKEPCVPALQNTSPSHDASSKSRAVTVAAEGAGETDAIATAPAAATANSPVAEVEAAS